MKREEEGKENKIRGAHRENVFLDHHLPGELHQFNCE